MKKSIYIIAGLLFSIILHCSAQQHKLSYHIPGKLPILKQKEDMACWITVATMMISWKVQKDYTVDSVAKILGDPWEIYYTTNVGLPPDEQKHFAAVFGLKSEPPASYTIEAYTSFLKSYGPLWVITGDDFGAHARLITGIEGDGSYDDTDLVIIDPMTGKSEKKNILVFIKEYEEEIKILNEQKWKGDLRIQIYHY